MKGKLSEQLSRFTPVIALVAVYLVFAVIAPPSFVSFKNLELIVRQTTIVGTAALGMTLVIISGGIDLSVGSVVALVTVAVALSLLCGCPPLIAAVSGLLVGIGCGLVNGALITRLRLVPFIITLAWIST